MRTVSCGVVSTGLGAPASEHRSMASAHAPAMRPVVDARTSPAAPSQHLPADHHAGEGEEQGDWDAHDPGRHDGPPGRAGDLERVGDRLELVVDLLVLLSVAARRWAAAGAEAAGWGWRPPRSSPPASRGRVCATGPVSRRRGSSRARRHRARPTRRCRSPSPRRARPATTPQGCGTRRRRALAARRPAPSQQQRRRTAPRSRRRVRGPRASWRSVRTSGPAGYPD